MLASRDTDSKHLGITGESGGVEPRGDAADIDVGGGAGAGGTVYEGTEEWDEVRESQPALVRPVIVNGRTQKQHRHLLPPSPVSLSSSILVLPFSSPFHIPVRHSHQHQAARLTRDFMYSQFHAATVRVMLEDQGCKLVRDEGSTTEDGLHEGQEVVELGQW
ncbi:hypothetical protein BJ165DRAFT_1410910 [Panaeolus papilionaceus]|nr:hypothetical protein BJ165DRAFT_1410910 [Panaeolus papilionaceus]